MTFKGFPFVVGWELTLACNLRCRHCSSSAGAPRPRELTTAEALSICDQFPALLVQEVELTGGEPLLRPDWPDIVTRLGRLGIPSKIMSNGLAMQADTVYRMADLGVAGVAVSLDGQADTHDSLRCQAGAFEAARNAIHRILRVGLPLTVVTTVHAGNVQDLPALLVRLQEWGVRRWQLQPVLPLGRSCHDESIPLHRNAYEKFGSFLVNAKESAQAHGLEIVPSESLGYFTEIDSRDPAWRGCPAGLLTCGITSDGRVKGCLSMPDDLTEGDLRQRDLWDIWFDPLSFSYTRRFTLAQLGPNCSFCPHASQCRGGCTAMSYGATGQPHNDPLCFWGIRWNMLRLAALPHAQHQEQIR
jgi:radical SAM protein with 4Fe4S-binding SPASM domain